LGGRGRGSEAKAGKHESGEVHVGVGVVVVGLFGRLIGKKVMCWMLFW
jgi:hypothetical protein